MTFAEYTTVDAVRSRYLSSDKDARDEVIHDLIVSTSREIEQICNRKFYPRTETRYYDTPTLGRVVTLDDDLLDVTAFTNGDGTAFSASQYKAYPLNESVKTELRVLQSSSAGLLADANGDSDGAINVAGVWGYHNDYASAWVVTAATLTTSITTTQTTAAVTPSVVKSGTLARIGSECIAVTAVSTSTSADTLTLTRGVNGGTAASHTAGDAILRWDAVVEMVCRMAVAAYFRLRTNPVGESVTIDGQTFQTPKDVLQWMDKHLRGMGLIRVGLG